MRNLTIAGPGLLSRGGVRSIACLLFVALLGAVFWAAAFWFGSLLLNDLVGR